MSSSSLATNSVYPSVPSLLGTITLLKRNGVVYQVIQGHWAYSGGANPEPFRLERKVRPREEPNALVSSASSFGGSFELKGESVVEEGVMIRFVHVGNELQVKGNGENEFGCFRLEGTATKSAGDDSAYNIQLQKYYTVKVGAKVLKEFSMNGGPPRPFEGVIKSYNKVNGMFTIQYHEDGEEEELDEDDTVEIAHDHAESEARKQKPSSGQRSKGPTPARACKVADCNNYKVARCDGYCQRHYRMCNSDTETSDTLQAVPPSDRYLANLTEKFTGIHGMVSNNKKTTDILSSKIDSVEGNLAEALAVVEDHVSKSEAGESKIMTRINSIQKSLSRNVRNTNDDLRKLQIENKYFAGKLDGLTGKFDRHEDRIVNLEAENATLRADNQSNTAQIATLHSNVARIAEQADTQGRELNMLKGKQFASSGASKGASDPPNYNHVSALILEDQNPKANDISAPKRKLPVTPASTSPRKSLKQESIPKPKPARAPKLKVPPSLKSLGPMCNGPRNRSKQH